MEIGANAEVPGDGSRKSPRGRMDNDDHWHDEDGQEKFIWIIFETTIGTCEICKAFVPWFRKIASTISLITNTGCKWDMKTNFMNNKVVLG
jgi:hypothetical protein